MKSRYIAYFLLLLVAVSCEPKLDDYTPSAGSADFSKYISVGNSLTAGYADGDLYLTSQNYSYPNIIAQQLKLVGGGEFKQPLMFDELGFGNKRVLQIVQPLDCSGNPDGDPSPMPVLAGGVPDQRNFTSIAANGPYNNLGVPGAKSFHLLLPNYGSLNPYFGRFTTSPLSKSVIGMAKESNASFFSLWIGNNDVLSYALAGGEGDAITSQETFEATYTMLLDSLTANGAKGFVGSIPDVTSVPYFNTIPYNGLVLVDQTDVDKLNLLHASIGTGIVFNLGQNPFIIEDPLAPNGKGMREMVEGELLLLSLPQDSIKCRGWGSQRPIRANFVLDINEIELLTDAVGGYNETIKSLADEKGLAYADANTFMKNAKSGIIFDGMRFSASFIRGGIFSLDGIHLSPRGNAIIANFFIDAINLKYNAAIPHVNVGDYPGLVFP
ncbi:MAG: hypothetical protein FD166_1014 [Bacteroidetes bacterium]|nr:MAG: hypothetical protein FD166_1014 [Bacteroidota bacterium]